MLYKKGENTLMSYEMSDGKKQECHVVIHAAATAAAGVAAGFAQLPVPDCIPITTIQVAMVVRLGTIFDMRISEGAAKSLLGSLGTMKAGRDIASFLIGKVPFFRNIVNSATAFALTETLGWAATLGGGGVAVGAISIAVAAGGVAVLTRLRNYEVQKLVDGRVLLKKR